MSDLICRNTMQRCQTPGMCAPHGGCKVSVLVQADVRYSNNSADTKLMPAPCTIHTANVFMPGCLGPVKRDVVLVEDHQELIDRLAYAQSEIARLEAANGALSAANTVRRNLIGAARKAAGIGPLDNLAAAITSLRRPECGDEIPDFTPGSGNKARLRAAAVGIDMDASMKAGALLPLPPPWRDVPENWVSNAERRCNDETCWACEGTGRNKKTGEICTYDGEIPF